MKLANYSSSVIYNYRSIVVTNTFLNGSPFNPNKEIRAFSVVINNRSIVSFETIYDIKVYPNHNIIIHYMHHRTKKTAQLRFKSKSEFDKLVNHLEKL